MPRRATSRPSRRVFYRLIDRNSDDPLPHDAGDFRLVDRSLVDVVVALSERDAAIARWERLAGEAFVKLTRDERLTLRDACEWAGDLTLAEAKRLRRLADEDEDAA